MSPHCTWIQIARQRNVHVRVSREELTASRRAERRPRRRRLGRDAACSVTTNQLRSSDRSAECPVSIEGHNRGLSAFVSCPAAAASAPVLRGAWFRGRQCGRETSVRDCRLAGRRSGPNEVLEQDPEPRRHDGALAPCRVFERTRQLLARQRRAWSVVPTPDA
jgi:hypothetical protein